MPKFRKGSKLTYKSLSGEIITARIHVVCDKYRAFVIPEGSTINRGVYVLLIACKPTK